MSLVPFEGLAEDIISAVTKYIPDTAAKDAAKAEITTLMIQAASQADSQQSNIDAIEASNTSLFVAGWRPALGWCCDFIFFEHYVLIPITKFIHSCYNGACVEPAFDVQEVNIVLWALLGIGAYRTVDKGIDIVMKALK